MIEKIIAISLKGKEGHFVTVGIAIVQRSVFPEAPESQSLIRPKRNTKTSGFNGISLKERRRELVSSRWVGNKTMEYLLHLNKELNPKQNMKSS